MFLLIFLLVITLSYVPRAENRDTLYQVSTLGALMKGDYDGEVDMKSLKRHGDFGIGTFNCLDGEMVALDGRIYQVKYDGVAHPADNNMKTPFAAVTFFDADKGLDPAPGLDLGGLSKAIDGIIENKNIPYAVRVRGRFDHIKARSVPRQNRPYRPLAEVVKEQSVFELRDIEGTIVGFRVPEYMQGLNAAGYHLHFISADRKAGGHLLQCATGRIRIDIDDTSEFHMTLSENGEFSRLDLSGSQAKDIEEAEK